jgi:hypothetical protein
MYFSRPFPILAKKNLSLAILVVSSTEQSINEKT